MEIKQILLISAIFGFQSQIYALESIKVDYVSQIKLILVKNSISCHGGEKQKGGLSLDSGDSLLRGGQVIGKTDELGWNIVEDPIYINELHAALLHLFGMDPLKLSFKFQGRDFRLTDVVCEVVNKLLA